MSKWIDAEWLLNFVAEFPDHYTLTVGNLRAVVNDAPSIDIVRCKECKHREEYPCKVYHDDDWFCADGERKGADDE